MTSIPSQLVNDDSQGSGHPLSPASDREETEALDAYSRVVVRVSAETWYRLRSSDWLYEAVDAALQRAETVLAAEVSKSD